MDEQFYGDIKKLCELEDRDFSNLVRHLLKREIRKKVNRQTKAVVAGRRRRQ